MFCLPNVLRVGVLGLAAAPLLVVGCSKAEPPAATAPIAAPATAVTPTATADPAFDSRWSSLADQGVDALYIEDDQGQGLMGSVRRAAKSQAPAPAAEIQPSLPEQLPNTEVQRIVRGNLPGVKTCYMTMTRAGVVRSGKAIVSFAIDPDGKVTEPRVEAPAFTGTALPGCVKGMVSHWAFPKSQKGGGSFTYPFVFVGG